ncbi:hypothetical protein [Streptosporangium roseum]|nr:hypothetical protein [Streptosporangium roseum]
MTGPPEALNAVPADQSHADPADEAAPVDQSVAQLRARTGWSAPTSP